MNHTTQLQLVSSSFTRDGGRDYNEDAVGDTTAYGAVRLFTLAATLQRTLPSHPPVQNSLACPRLVATR
jgi:hypothetical protein